MVFIHGKVKSELNHDSQNLLTQLQTYDLKGIMVHWHCINQNNRLISYIEKEHTYNEEIHSYIEEVQLFSCTWPFEDYINGNSCERGCVYVLWILR